MSLYLLALKASARSPVGFRPSSYRDVFFRGMQTGAHRRTGYQPVRLGLLTVGLLGGSLYFALPSKVYADAVEKPGEGKGRTLTPLSTLFRTYGVYSMCSFPALIDWAPSILSFLSSIPVVKQITEAIVRQTFFAQFVGGESAEDCMPLLAQLRAQNKGCLFAYSVEVDEDEAAGQGHGKSAVPVHKRVIEEMIHSIDVAADFEDNHLNDKASLQGRRTWVAIKLTALVPDAQSLINFSKYLLKARPPLSPPVAFPGCPRSTDMNIVIAGKVPAGSPLREQDVKDLKELHDDLVRICLHAQKRGVRLIVDAEYSWYQPAIDAITLSLMRQFNKLPSRLLLSDTPAQVQPLVYATFQAYLRRTPEYLVQSFKDAEVGNYSLGVKLVRGAYHPHEIAAHVSTSASSSPDSSPSSSAHSLSISPDPYPPVWTSKLETDVCYNTAVKVLVSAVRKDMETRKKRNGALGVGVLFGSHNWESCDLILEELVRQGLANKEVDEGGREVITVGTDLGERVTIGQLYGMNDALGNSIVDRTRSPHPFLIKYIPYGALSEVMPYLSRRAIENKSVLGNGQAEDEKRRAWEEIRARLFG